MQTPVRHLGAAIASTAFVAISLSLSYLALVAWSALATGDIGGPLNFILVPTGAVLVGIACQLLFIPIAVLSIHLVALRVVSRGHD